MRILALLITSISLAGAASAQPPKNTDAAGGWYYYDHGLDDYAYDDAPVGYQTPTNSPYRPGLIHMLFGLLKGDKEKPVSGEPKLPPGVKKLYASNDSAWLLMEGKGKANCSLAFEQAGHLLVFSGPAGKRPGVISFAGPDVPVTQVPRETEIIIRASAQPLSLRAFLFPGEQSGVLVVPATIPETLSSLADSESVEVSMEGREVFQVRTEASFLARDAMLRCMK